MLECQNLSVCYRRGRPILSHVSLTIPAGAITALLGVNGAGKTTLFKAILQEIPYTGQIFCDNTALCALSPRERARRISLLPQHLPAPALTVRETVALGLSPHVTRMGAVEWKKVAEWVEKLGISDLIDRPVSTLSGGERQKVFFAMQLAQDAPVMLLDEPTAHMDLAFVARFFEILREQASDGKAILLVTHDVSEAFAYADRIAVLKDSGLAFAGTTNEALEKSIPEKHFGLIRYTAKRGEKTAIFFKAE